MWIIYIILSKIIGRKVRILSDSRRRQVPAWLKRLQIIDSTTIMLFSNAILKGVGRHPKTNKIKMNNGGLYRKRNYHEFCVSENWGCYNYV